MKNKIYKYDFLILGAGLIGSITALALVKKKFKVLVIDNRNLTIKDNRTLAVNANSMDFLKQLGIWSKLKSQPQPIDKIVIKDKINTQPLIFENENETMGNVIYNKEVHKISRQILNNLKIFKTDSSIDISDISPNKRINIDKKNYVFKKIVICIGKNIVSKIAHKSIIFDQGHQSYVGFFKHFRDHNNTAYEFFTDNGPLAILPAPKGNKKKSTFIYSTKEKINYYQIQKLINKNLKISHGQLVFDKSITKFPVKPHLTKNNKNFIFVGDSLKSIHPVAGQGWNLGVKDIQTLCKLLDQYSIDVKDFNTIYYSKRIIESTVYFSFTTLLNYLYESRNPMKSRFIEMGYNTLIRVKFVRDLFIKQAMGRINLID